MTYAMETQHMKYKCVKCDHTHFKMKYGLAKHVSVNHKSHGARCNICGKNMLHYHLPDHMDSHSLMDRYICKEKVKRSGSVCNKGYKQKFSIRQHLKNDHKGKPLMSANVEIKDVNELEYEMKEDYEVDEEERELTADEVNKLVDEWGQEVYLE